MSDTRGSAPDETVTSGAKASSEAKASIKEAIGKLTGDMKAEAEGQAEKTGGHVRDGARPLTDEVKGKS